MDHFFVAQIEHGRFNIFLSDDQFFAKTTPIRLLGQIKKLLAVPTHSLLYAKPFGSAEQFAAQRFDRFDFFPFDREESVANQDAETERELHAVVETKRPRRTCQLLDGNRLQRIQCIEQLFDRGSGVLIDSELLPKMRIRATDRNPPGLSDFRRKPKSNRQKGWRKSRATIR